MRDTGDGLATDLADESGGSWSASGAGEPGSREFQALKQKTRRKHERKLPTVSRGEGKGKGEAQRQAVMRVA
jgi:hypothetical protein